MKEKRKWIAGLLTLALGVSLVTCTGKSAGASEQDPPMAAGSLLAQATGKEKGKTPFSDIAESADYAEAVAWCYEQGLMNGIDGDRFDPLGTLTRAVMATVLYRAKGEPVVNAEIPFSDVQAGAWYANAVVWADSVGLMEGYGNGLFGIEDPVSQEQLDIILCRYKGESPVWAGDPALAGPATRAQVAMALMGALKEDIPAPEVTSAPKGEGGRVLVAYFSNTNNTKNVAEKIAASLENADLYQITPEVPYTAADLNYNTDCRANREQNDPNARPAINGSVEHWEEYGTVFLGYPIWWGVPPKIMHTFMESYDFSGKTVIPFCTSGSSGYNDTAIKALVGEEVIWLTGRRFGSGASQSDIQSWVDGLNLSGGEETTTQLKVTFNGHTYAAVLADNASARAFADLIREKGGKLTVPASDYGSFEKVAPLGTSLPSDNSQIATVPGDFVLYNGNQIVLFYGSNSWSYTRLGKLEGDLSNLKADLGSGNVDITYALDE